MFPVTAEFPPAEDPRALRRGVGFHSLYECILLGGDGEFGGTEGTLGPAFHLLDFNKENFYNYIDVCDYRIILSISRASKEEKAVKIARALPCVVSGGIFCAIFMAYQEIITIAICISAAGKSSVCKRKPTLYWLWAALWWGEK